MNRFWRIAGGGVFVALCSALTVAGQDAIVAPIMRTQVRSAISPLGDDSAEPTGEADPFDALLDGDVEAAAWLQQPGTVPTLATSQPTVRRAATASRLASTSLASVPNMFGDLPMSTVFIESINTAGGPQAFASAFTLPLAGASRIGKISENDSPIPRDRVFFNYNHFQNVFQLSETSIFPPAPTVIRQEPIDRYTLGAEKTFFDGWTSVEVRMPLLGSFDTQLQSVGVNGASWGNLTFVLKSLLYMDNATAIGAGMSIETPTGSSTTTRLATTRLQFLNQSTHLSPYIGFVWSPGDPRWGWGNGLFLTGYAQIDIATASNTVNVLSPPGFPASPPLGKLTDQNLGFLDLGAGYWLYRDSYAPRWTGLAVIGELHYTTTLQDADRIVGAPNGIPVLLNATGNRFDVLNGTIGLQALMFDASSFRVAGVFPLGNEDHRLFDSEVQFQFNRRF
jgi:hypothetical protein